MSNCWKRIAAVISQQMKAARQEQGDSHPQQVLSTEKSQFLEIGMHLAFLSV